MMDSVALVIGAAACLAALISAAEMAFGGRMLRRLKDTAPLGEPCGKVSIVVAARNEERHIAGAVQSLIGQTYPDVEIIVVNDRSTDGTGTILDDLAQTSDRLKVIHITELPAGWLGKNHALHTGANCASGKYLLFTDADVVMAPTAVGSAMAYMRERNVDHLPVVPGVRRQGFWLGMLVSAFLYLFTLAKKPWLVRCRGPFHMGVGAFNLITADAYAEIGGHRRIALRPDDDMMLGKLVKVAGMRQDMPIGRDLIELEWYASCGEMIRGLEKNAFAGLGYSIAFATLVCVFMLAVFVAPPVAALFTSGWPRILNLAAYVLWVGSWADQSRLWKTRAYLAPFYPLGVLLLLYTIVRAVAETLFAGGIMWRGRFYPLKELRNNQA